MSSGFRLNADAAIHLDPASPPMPDIRSMLRNAIGPDQTVLTRPACIRFETVRKTAPCTVPAPLFTLQHRRSVLKPLTAITTTPLPAGEAPDFGEQKIGETVSLPTLTEVHANLCDPDT